MVLERINSPDDVRNLPESELETLASELRDFLISSVSVTGGHLAPNLGAVELTIALHRVFNSPADKIVWDVGHQAYIHKILTGRKDRFATLRQYNGISGFPKISESEHDAFGVGHSSTSISAALGLATARDLKGGDHAVVAVIGDGALSGGIAFEGLNNAGGSKRNLIVVLNDNRMSISPNVGAMSRYLTTIITNPFYNRLKKEIWDATGKFPRHSSRIRKMVKRIEEALKSVLVPGLLFERLGFRYVGPVNGHDIPSLIKVFGEIKRLNGPILVHVITTKGKGYKFAEDDSTKFHGLGSFCRETGDTPANDAPAYTEVFGKTLVELAEKDDTIVAITAAMAHGTGLIHFARTFEDRFFDVGIAEQHAVTFGCGLALEGFKPVIAIYSTFLQRAYDQVIHDAALQNIPIKLILDRGGLVGADGPTHHGSFDLSYLRLVPGIVIMTPRDENELRDMLYTALEYNDGPVVLRYPRGQSLGLPAKQKLDRLEIGKAELLRKGTDLTILAAGDMVQTAVKAAELLENRGRSTQVINVRFIKPLDEEMIVRAARETKAVITLENNSVVGGLGGAVAELLSENALAVPFRRFGLPDRFVTHGSVSLLFSELALDTESLVSSIITWLE
ncbi:1-deoxy-D-xylulose-5-phosphate synthase [bacterium]|nr:1-deoxy-D-xylulose-5-phosphate synthase [bacterium]